MKIYVVKYQRRPRCAWETSLVTEDREVAESRQFSVRRGYIVAWENGRVVSCGEPRVADPNLWE